MVGFENLHDRQISSSQANHIGQGCASYHYYHEDSTFCIASFVVVGRHYHIRIVLNVRLFAAISVTSRLG